MSELILIIAICIFLYVRWHLHDPIVSAITHFSNNPKLSKYRLLTIFGKLGFGKLGIVKMGFDKLVLSRFYSENSIST